MTHCVALIVSAGRGHRIGGAIPKQYRDLAGVPILRRTLDAVLNHPSVDAVRVVIHPDDEALYHTATNGLDILPPVFGAAERQDSVRLGLESLEDLAPKLVLIHDSVRPFVDAALIDRVIDVISASNGVIPAVPVADTLKRAENSRITDTVDRADLWRAQTPQGFPFAKILAAHRQAEGQNLTDDAMVAEAAGLAVNIVTGAEANMKITTGEDLMRAEQSLGTTSGETRIGIGYDVHKFTDGDHVTICGIDIPHTHALEGHSDADVGLHAMTDAILGAIGAGDIGTYFPPSDPQWTGAASDIFLHHAVEKVRDMGGVLQNLDITIICEAPKIVPNREAMTNRVAEITGLGPDRINIKGKTTEKLGFTGRREGIAAEAVASVRL
ncbi:MAG: bifunctional 2-C-methyl-D-erythritol 4-phosphate cytidylyltransferase/2-C-methyl-D-erythritol 2,4-cyclodiphosphate synthase [Rhodospirillaceae bacterium]